MSDAMFRVDALEKLQATLAAFDWTGLTDGRRQILDAFLRLATTTGYSSVTMRALGKQVNVKAPSLYSHFPGGRDELVGAALRWHYSQWAEGVVEVLRATNDPKTFLDVLVDHHVRSQLTMLENDMFDLLLATDRISGILPAETRAEARHLVGLYDALYVGVIRDLGYEGDLSRLAAAIITVLDGVRSWSGWDGDEASLGAIVDTASQVVGAMLESLSRAPIDVR
ncbi:hypothetical protein B1729_03610 [Microbacterium sp. B35-04]|uniref:TetR/AcrR family transcriptional regulator n=1 Tax=unclassified Microbacterium TaxID=2609290 RepID=UPI0013D2528B|nr:MULTISPECIES: TetR/AcrR family transcriptional regulator [unclassified Microbacterium]KAF2414677.1 hypothetical protein B1729_03610 [Microbacterium sp. B35-04]KAF2417609.1 hypothetical protein B2K11_11800 [Microbacterium sp. B35-30]